VGGEWTGGDVGGDVHACIATVGEDQLIHRHQDGDWQARTTRVRWVGRRFVWEVGTEERSFEPRSAAGC
jgi:hypothetical protein